MTTVALASPQSTVGLPMARFALDRLGHRWRIAEVRAPVVAGDLLPYCLVLSSANRCVRRLSYPSDWTYRSIDELLALPEESDSCRS